MKQKNIYRILLIDDQETIHEDYRKILGAQPAASELTRAAAELFDDDPTTLVAWEGFEIDSALQGEQGFELVQESIAEGRPYAVAFVDIRMPPGWDGIQTVQRIWEVDPEILVVVCSAYSDHTWEDMVRQLGRNDRFLILKKPFDNIEVRQCAMALTERWSVSRTDVLTGLLNRRSFHGHLQLEWARSLRHQLPLACAMVDLDYFKRVNDTLGHHAGDVVLRAVAHVLKSNCRASDCVCRYGGEELCVLLPHTTEAGAAAWAEHARQAIASAAIRVGEHALQVTASVGVAERLEPCDRMERMMDRADQALMVAKKLGRNRVVRYSDTFESGVAIEDVNNQLNLFQGVVARQVMTAPIASLHMHTTAGEAADFFLRLRINSAPVIDEEGRLAGILSEKDVIGIMLDPEAWSTPVEQIMQRNVICYEEDASVQSICEFLGRVAIRRVVIIRDGRPTGVLSRGSLLRWYSKWIHAHRAPAAVPSLPSPPEESRVRVVQGVQAVAECAAALSDSLVGEIDDLAPVVEGVAKLQELIDELLDSSRDASTERAKNAL